MRIERRTWVEALVLLVAAVLAFAEIPSRVVEIWFSTGLYPRLQRVITPLSNMVPFAWLDVVCVAGVAAILFFLIRAVRQAWRTRRWQPVGRAAWRLTVVAAAAYLVFLTLWGFNYRRVPMTARIVLDRPAPSSEDVLALGLDAVSRLNALYADAHRIGWPEEVWRDARLREAFAASQRLLADAPLAEPGRLKQTMFGPYFRWSSVDGMVNPFGLEVLANPDLLPYERPFVIAHEWAHLAGYADESEANFVGWLTAIRADVPSQYSGWLFMFWQVNGEVGEEARAKLGAVLEDGPRADLNAIIERLRRGQLPAVRRAGWAVYDQYLKANRVEAGVRSYGAVLTLILRARFEAGWTPVRRIF